MTGRILQINVSPGGVPKRPVEAARVTPFGIEGDSWAHPTIHGGTEKAVLILASEVVDELIARGYPLFYGALGENLTTAGIDRRLIRPGQRYRIGDVLIEITRIRASCSSLDIYGPSLKHEIYVKHIAPSDPAWGMSGFYASVVQGGEIRAGDVIALLDQMV
jgi:MOSC domain-containing protein YiiM